MTDEAPPAAEETESQQRRRLHGTAREQLLERQFSNSESYDKAILTLSSAFLGLSLTFIKDVLPGGPPAAGPLLYLSWTAFALAIVSTVISFRVSDAALAQRLKQIERYYLQNVDSDAERTGLAVAVDWLNNVAGALFILGVVLTVVFVTLNFPEATRMSTHKSGSGPTRIDEGHTVPPMEKVLVEPLKRGQSIPHIQPVTPPTPANQTQPPAPPPPAAAPPTPPVPKK